MVCTLFRRALLAWGVPEAVKTDRGKEYLSDHFKRVIRDLELIHIECRPYTPKQKPFIERAFETFAYGLLELKPDYIGHSVAERKAIESREAFARRMMTRGETIEARTSAAELQAFCDDWCEAIYGRNPHEGLGGQSPFERMASWREPVRKISDERALDILLSPVPRNGGWRTVEAKGIHVESGRYIHPDLAAGHIDKRVFCRWDQDNIGRIYVFGGRGRRQFLCIAICPEREELHISLKEMAAAAHARQKEFLKEQERELKEARKALGKADLTDAVIDYRKAQADKVALFPHATIPHETPVLSEAAAAVRAAHRLVNPPTATISPEAHERFLRAMECYEAREQIEEPRDRYERLWKLGAQARTPEEEAWMRTFETTPTGRATLFFLEDRESSLQEAAREREERRKASAG